MVYRRRSERATVDICDLCRYPARWRLAPAVLPPAHGPAPSLVCGRHIMAALQQWEERGDYKRFEVTTI